MNFFPEKKGRKGTSIKEKYNMPVLRLPEMGSGRATFEFNKELVEQLGLTPDNHLVFAISDNSLYAIVTDVIPEGTKPRSLSVGKSEQTSSLGKVRKASSKPVAEWMFNSLSWLREEMDLFVKLTSEEINGNQVYELVDGGQPTEREEAQMADEADYIIATEGNFQNSNI